MSNRRGFSLLELMMVLAIGGLLVLVVVNSFSAVQGRMGTGAAQSNFLTMHAHTRALAVERGVLAWLEVDPTTGTVSISTQADLDDPTRELVRERNFESSYNVEIVTRSGGALEICMTPKGYGATKQGVGAADCGGVGQEDRVNFVRDDAASGVVLLPLGQAMRP